MASHRRKQRKLNKKNKGYNATGYNRHHRKPKFHGGKNNSENISIVLKRHHNIFNELFGSAPTPYDVARILTEVWIDPAYEIIVRRKNENHTKNVLSTSPQQREPAQSTTEVSSEEDCHLGHA